MKLIIDNALKAEKGDFGYLTDKMTFCVPRAYFPVLRFLGVSTVEALYEASLQDPETVKKMLKWNDKELKKGITELRWSIDEGRPKYLTTKLKPMREFQFGYIKKDDH